MPESPFPGEVRKPEARKRKNPVATAEKNEVCAGVKEKPNREVRLQEQRYSINPYEGMENLRISAGKSRFPGVRP